MKRVCKCYLLRWLRVFYDHELLLLARSGHNFSLEKRGPAIPDASYDDATIEYNNETIRVKSFIRLVDCEKWPVLNRMVKEEEGEWSWKEDFSQSLPKTIFLRSSYRALQEHPEVYEEAQQRHSFGGLTSPGKNAQVWDERFDEAIIKPAQRLVDMVHAENKPDDDSETLVPYSIQLLKYSKGRFKRGAHHDPEAYEYIVACNIKGHATIDLLMGRRLWSQPVTEGEMYLLAGHGIRPWKHKVVCHGSSDRIVAVLRFVRLSKLQPLLMKVRKSKVPTGVQTRSHT